MQFTKEQFNRNYAWRYSEQHKEGGVANSELVPPAERV